ncbi:hypothetical protein J8J27_25680, partial [Mycobacterium tuberculosis]|nr:hypothetical protein [Mycobacterium tuberculosis]
MLVTNEDAFHVIARAEPGSIAAGAPLMTVAPLAVTAPPPATRAEEGKGVAVETAAFDAALATLTAHVRDQAAEGRTVQQREIMAAHVALLD